MSVANIFGGIPGEIPEEIVETLAGSDHVRIERIVSHGQASPPGFWYDQDMHEWVILLSGKTRLLLEGPEETVDLSPGDWINIPARRKHRVEWTEPKENTVWVAVFY